MNSKEKLLKQAIKLAIKQGYRNIKRDMVAQKVKLSPALVNHYFGTIENLQTEVLKYAIKTRILILVAQGLSLRDPVVFKLTSPEVRKDAAFSLLD